MGTGISKQESTGTGCAATCKAERGTCESLNGHVQCVCRPDSMWSSGNSDGSPNLEKCDKEECPGRCGMDDARCVVVVFCRLLSSFVICCCCFESVADTFSSLLSFFLSF